MAITTPHDVRQLGTILCVWAHPDDESFCCAGILAAAVANGQKVVCVTATKGEAGVQDESRWPADKLGDIRAAELGTALEILGVADHHWLGYTDGTCEAADMAEAISKIKDFMNDVKPDTILTFGPDGMTGHPDHQSVSRWVGEATKGSGITVYHVVENQATYDKYMKELDKRFNIYFMIDKPPLKTDEECDIAMCLTPELVQKKFAALKAMPSQTESLLNAMPSDQLKDIFRCECFVKA